MTVQRTTITEREHTIAWQREEGWTLVGIGSHHGLTRQRVHQLLHIIARRHRAAQRIGRIILGTPSNPPHAHPVTHAPTSDALTPDIAIWTALRARVSHLQQDQTG